MRDNKNNQTNSFPSKFIIKIYCTVHTLLRAVAYCVAITLFISRWNLENKGRSFSNRLQRTIILNC